MGTKVYFIPASGDKTARNSFFDQILRETAGAVPESSGFLCLTGFRMSDLSKVQSLYQLLGENNNICFFGRTLRGIVGGVDVSGHEGIWKPLHNWNDENWKDSLVIRDRRDGAEIGHLKGGILHRDEFARFRQDWYAQYPERRALLEQRTAVIMGSHVETVLPWDGVSPVYYIPVYRCRTPETAGWEEQLRELLSLGFLPILRSESYKNLTNQPQFWAWLEAFAKEASSAEDVADGRTIETLLEKIKRADYERAHIPAYSDEIFQVDQGCWDLWPYVQYRPGNPPPDPKRYLDVSGQELYARNPQTDTAAEDEWAAIDFGTRSTMVAVWQGNGVHMRRVGMQGEEQIFETGSDGRSPYENPTILRFIDIDAFLSAYRAQPGRPETKFDQIPVSTEAQVDFVSKIISQRDLPLDQIRQFQDQLKQWMDDPARSIYAKYKNEWRELKYSDLDADAPDPVEIYAYYIGLYLNNMLQGKIYLKYLLSFSATYFKGNLDRFRESFARGLRKSLPREVLEDLEDPNTASKLEVKLYLDEATAYAVSAILRYRAQAAAKERGTWKPDRQGGPELPKIKDYTEAMQSGGLFYGIYDFGGGTLDYSFGLMTREEGKDVFRPLERGGASRSGCENILEDLAYKIFSENRQKLVQKKIFCLVPPWLTDTVNEPLAQAGHSAAACFNTLSLVEKLRDRWIKAEKAPVDFRLRAEDGSSYDATLWGSEKDSDQKLVLQSEEQMEKFFEDRIVEGVKGFLWQFEYTARKHGCGDRPRFIFLGGNASQADLVMETFEKQIKEEETLGRPYFLHPQLPTAYDSEQEKKTPDASYPNAKSGVVYGLLMARPHSASVLVSSQEMPFRYFQYHIGRRVPDEVYYDPNGLFSLVASASDLNPDAFFCLGQVPANNQLELLYTWKPEYGFHRELAEMLSAAQVSAAVVPIPLCWDDQYFLYCRPSGKSDKVLELWISSQKAGKLEDAGDLEALLGWFTCFPKPEFTAFNPDTFFIRFLQEDGKEQKFHSFRQIPSSVQPEDLPVFSVSDSPMRIQYGPAGGTEEYVLPAGFFQDQECLYCYCEKPGLLKLIAVGAGGMREFCLDLWRKTIYPG